MMKRPAAACAVPLEPRGRAAKRGVVASPGRAAPPPSQPRKSARLAAASTGDRRACVTPRQPVDLLAASPEEHEEGQTDGIFAAKRAEQAERQAAVAERQAAVAERTASELRERIEQSKKRAAEATDVLAKKMKELHTANMRVAEVSNRAAFAEGSASALKDQCDKLGDAEQKAVAAEIRAARAEGRVEVLCELHGNLPEMLRAVMSTLRAQQDVEGPTLMAHQIRPKREVTDVPDVVVWPRRGDRLSLVDGGYTDGADEPLRCAEESRSLT